MAALMLLGCGKPLPKEEHLCIVGFVKGVEIIRNHSWTGVDITAIGFEDGRVKFFYDSIPDMVKQGSNNKIFFKRKYNNSGEFYDKLDGVTAYPEPKEPK